MQAAQQRLDLPRRVVARGQEEPSFHGRRGLFVAYWRYTLSLSLSLTALALEMITTTARDRSGASEQRD